MRSQEVAQRYARALFKFSQEEKAVEGVLNQVREVNSAIEGDESLKLFFTGPAVNKSEQVSALAKLFENKKISEPVKGLLSVLAQKRRLAYLPDIVTAFQTAVDESQGISRGTVVSATTLFPEDRLALEATISRYTGKKVVLEYNEDPKLVGGLVAKVGSYTFDDTLETQLSLLRESIKKRRAH